MFMPKQASVMANGIDGERPAPGFMSVPSANRHVAIDQQPRWREASGLR
jgi:hypothetical protein